MAKREAKKGCLLSLFSLLIGKRPGGDEAASDAAGFKLSRRGPLLSKAEARFEAALREAVGPDERLFAKVRLGDLFIVRGGPEATGMRNRINQKHVDFAIVTRDTLRLVAGVELDDRTHRRQQAAAADAVKDEAFVAAGVPMLRVSATASYDAGELAQRIATLR